MPAEEKSLEQLLLDSNESEGGTPEVIAPVVEGKPEGEDPPTTQLPPERKEPAADDPFKLEADELAKASKDKGIENIRKAYVEARKREADLANRLKQAEQNAKPPADYEDLKQKAERMSSELERVALERHPEFQRRFQSQVERLDAQAKKTVSSLAVEISPDEFVALLRSEPSKAKTEKLNELLEGSSALSASSVANLVAQYESVGEARTQMLNKQRESLAALEEESRSANQQRLMAEQNGFNAALAEAENTFEYLKPVEGNEPWNKLVSQIKQRAKDLYFTEKNPARLMRATVLAAMAEPYRNAYLLERARADKLAAQLKAIDESKPDFKGGSKPMNGADKDWDESADFATNLARKAEQRSGLGGRV